MNPYDEGEPTLDYLVFRNIKLNHVGLVGKRKGIGLIED